MSDEQVNALPETERAAIIQLVRTITSFFGFFLFSFQVEYWFSCSPSRVFITPFQLPSLDVMFMFFFFLFSSVHNLEELSLLRYIARFLIAKSPLTLKIAQIGDSEQQIESTFY